MDHKMITTTFSAIFLTLTLTISLFHLSTSQTTTLSSSSNLVEDICKRAALIPPTKFEDCVATFASKPGSRSADLKGLAQITLKSGISNATKAIKHVEDLLAGARGLAPALKDPLKNCSMWFSAAKDSFGSALVELDEDLESANYDVKIAGDDARNCRGALAAGKVAEASVEVRVGYLVLYSDIGDVITDLLITKSL